MTRVYESPHRLSAARAGGVFCLLVFFPVVVEDSESEVRQAPIIFLRLFCQPRLEVAVLRRIYDDSPQF